MEKTVKGARRGQITLPSKIRKQCGIKEGDSLLVQITEKGILFRPMPKLLDMAGIDAGYVTVEEVNKMIDKLREEY